MKNHLALLIAAKHALLSYANGNGVPDLGRDLAAQIETALGAVPKGFGLPMLQEPKYTTCPLTGLLLNRASGNLIPADEPVMLFRGQDAKARRAIQCYVDTIIERGDGSHHKNVCFERYQQFVNFAEQHPERMKQPDTAKDPA